MKGSKLSRLRCQNDFAFDGSPLDLELRNLSFAICTSRLATHPGLLRCQNEFAIYGPPTALEVQNLGVAMPEWVCALKVTTRSWNFKT
jgi:hypothetical protein